MTTARSTRLGAAALLATALVLGGAACGRGDVPARIETDGSQAVQDATASTNAVPGADPEVVDEVTASLEASAHACSQPADQPPDENTREARDVVPGKIVVSGSDGESCLVGVADVVIVDDTASIPAFVPITPIDGSTEVIGYWADGYGWVTPEQRQDPDFDLAARQRAYSQIISGG